VPRSASRRASASRALVTAWSSASFWSPRLGVRISTLCWAAIASALSISSRSSTSWLVRISFGAGRAS